MKSCYSEPVALASARGPGGVYRLACTQAGLVLASLPQKRRASVTGAGRRPADGGFRTRLNLLLARPPAADLSRAHDPRELVERLCAYVENWDSETAWQLFWNPPPLDLRATLFRRRVWSKLRALPPGERLSYQELAQRAGSPRAARAVGTAMRENPAPLFIPCHRVVAAKGLGGFGAAGLELKARLLRLESPQAREAQPAGSKPASVLHARR